MVQSMEPLTRSQRFLVLGAAFFSWMFAGLEISLFILVHRQMMLELLGSGALEETVTKWFAWYQAAFLFGAAAGGWIFGWLGDRIGRTRSMGLSVLCYSLFTLLCYSADNVYLMWCLRLLACLGVGGVWPNAVALVAEAWPDASRPWLAGILGAAANFGFVLLGLIGYQFAITVDAWRWVLLVGASPALIGVVVLLVVPESRRWLDSRRNRDHATVATPLQATPLRDVLTPPLLRRTLLGISLGAVPLIGTSANANWLIPWTDQVQSQNAAAAHPETAESGRSTAAKPPPKKVGDARSKAKTQITRSGGAIFGSLLGGVIASFVGRRLTYFLISLGSFCISTYIFTQLNPLHPQFQLFTFLLGFVGVTYFGWLPLFLPELFPTRVRSTGAGISFNTGRVVAAALVLSAGFQITLFRGDYARVGFWGGMVYVVGMFIIWLAPRHDAARLED
jgi:MFS transporter, SHS family, sialic acid transporter